MASRLIACGWLAVLTGAALLPPVLLAVMQSGERTSLGDAVVTVGGLLIVFGLAAVGQGMRRPTGPGLPSGVRTAIAANVLFMAFFTLELSDRLITRNGKVFYWSTFLLPPALAMFYGLLAARPWAWSVSRGAAACGVIWFVGFLALVPFVHLQAEGVPITWQGRVYTAVVTLVFAAALAAAFQALGRPDTRNYFGVPHRPVGAGR